MEFTQPPKLSWVRLESEFEGGTPSNAFWGARLAHGWLIWNHLNQTMAFVPDPPDAAMIGARDPSSATYRAAR
jgi:hypothetical protein